MARKAKWTIEMVQEAALKCNTRSEFNAKYHDAYMSAWRNGWIDEVCSHMGYKEESKGLKKYLDIIG